jgi:hypothetical protein
MDLPVDHNILKTVNEKRSIDVHDFDQIDGDLHKILNRVQILVGYGLLQKQDNRIYLTEWGAEYLDGTRGGGEFELE